MERAERLRSTARAVLAGALACAALTIPMTAPAGAAGWQQAYQWLHCEQLPVTNDDRNDNPVPEECEGSASSASHSGLLEAKAKWTGQLSAEPGSGLSGAGASVHRFVKIDRPAAAVSFTGTFGVGSDAVSASAKEGTRARVELLVAVRPLGCPECEVVARVFPADTLQEADGSQTAPAGDVSLTVTLSEPTPGWYRVIQVIYVFATGPHLLGPPAQATAEATVLAKGFEIEGG